MPIQDQSNTISRNMAAAGTVLVFGATGKTIADRAPVHHVQHLVYTSVNAAGSGPTGMGHFDSKAERAGTECLPRRAGLPRR